MMILIQFIKIRNCTPSFKHQGFPVFFSINYSFYVFFHEHWKLATAFWCYITHFRRKHNIFKALQGSKSTAGCTGISLTQ